jgi:hypothetical protein
VETNNWNKEKNSFGISYTLKIDMMFVNFAWLMISSLVLKNMDHGSLHDYSFKPSHISTFIYHFKLPNSISVVPNNIKSGVFSIPIRVCCWWMVQDLGFLLYKHCTIDMPHNSCFESTIQISSMFQTQFCDAAKVAVIHRKI